MENHEKESVNKKKRERQMLEVFVTDLGKFLMMFSTGRVSDRNALAGVCSGFAFLSYQIGYEGSLKFKKSISAAQRYLESLDSKNDDDSKFPAFTSQSQQLLDKLETELGDSKWALNFPKRYKHVVSVMRGETSIAMALDSLKELEGYSDTIYYLQGVPHTGYGFNLDARPELEYADFSYFRRR